MKIILHLLSIVPLVLPYSDVSDKIHFEDIIKKPEELKAQLLCYLDRGPCDEVAMQHKQHFGRTAHISEALHDGCANCTLIHKHNVHVFLQGASHLFPEIFDEYRNKFDPDGTYFPDFLVKIDKY